MICIDTYTGTYTGAYTDTYTARITLTTSMPSLNNFLYNETSSYTANNYYKETPYYSNWYNVSCEGASSSSLYGGLYYDEVDPKKEIRRIIHKRHFPAIHVRSPISTSSTPVPGNSGETRARETLRLIVGEEQFRRFLRRGFVTIRGASGKIYQIFHKQHHFTYVWENGRCVERLCIYLKGNFPATDFIITLYLMIMNNEERVWQIGNKMGGRCQVRQLEEIKSGPRSLGEIYADLKQGKRIAA
jgi:hypothetical protein